MPLVMLKRSWTSNFRRTVKNKAGETRVVVWAPGEVQEVTADEVPSVAGDLGKALVAVEYDEQKRKHVIVDHTQIDLTGTASTSEPTADPVPPAGDPAPKDSENGSNTSRRSRK